jgi:hypothetical protein
VPSLYSIFADLSRALVGFQPKVTARDLPSPEYRGKGEHGSVANKEVVHSLLKMFEKDRQKSENGLHF